MNKSHNNSAPEIVSPAGNPEKLKFAVKYGADAVYFGGGEFNLRTQAGNFSFDELIESIAYCSEHNVKTIFLMNSFLHEDDLATATEFISAIKDLNFYAIMVSDPGMLYMLKESGINAEFHLSTQMNTLNHLSVKFWRDAGFKRIVLGREATLDEIRKIRDNTDAEIEVFVHGALCIAYSGRCLLSRYLSGRDANRGDCSQPCRWKFSLLEEKRPGNYMDIIEHGENTEILSSKDLCLIEKIEDYIEAGVHAFKIEGRMKSLYYAANTTRIYKHAVKKSGTGDFKKYLPFWIKELDLINHRPYTDDLFNEFNNMEFTGIPYVKKALFLGCKCGGSGDSNTADVKLYNPVYLNDKVDSIFPIVNDKIPDRTFTVKNIFDREGNKIDMGRPGEIVRIDFDAPVADNAIFRKKLNNKYQI